MGIFGAGEEDGAHYATYHFGFEDERGGPQELRPAPSWQPARKGGPQVYNRKEQNSARTSLAVQWLGVYVTTAGSLGLIPGQGTKILQAPQHSLKKKKIANKNEFRNRFFQSLQKITHSGQHHVIL